MAWSFVSPASRGIGFHLTRQLLQTTKIPIVATARKDVDGVKKSILQDLPYVDPDRLTVLEVDVTGKPLDQANNSKSNTKLTLTQTKIRSSRLQKTPNPCSPPTTTSTSPSASPVSFTRKSHPPKSTTSSLLKPSPSTQSVLSCSPNTSLPSSPPKPQPFPNHQVCHPTQSGSTCLRASAQPRKTSSEDGIHIVLPKLASRR